MCTNCSGGVPTYYNYQQSPCTTSVTSTGNIDSSKVIYTGPALTGLGIDPNTTIEVALSEINDIVGDITGINWASFNYYCLDDGGPITTAQGFVQAISSYVCTTNTTLNNFITTTYANEVAELENSIVGILNPNLISCTSIDIQETDNLLQVLTKIIDGLCAVNVYVNPADADWNSCFTTDPVPTNVVDAFDAIIDQICIIKGQVANIPVLPIFSNIGSCLPGPLTDADTLISTINKIKTKLCSLPTFDIDSISWTSCITNPNPGGGADLISAIQKIVTYLDSVNSYKVTSFNSDYFIVGGDSCTGRTVTLRNDIGFSDRFVALNSGDTSPNYLLNKITAGTNLSFDTSTTPGTVILNVPTPLNDKVKANAGDTSADYLINKIHGVADTTSSISLTESYNAGTDKVDMTLAIAYPNLADGILDAISGSTDLKDALRTIICSLDACDSTTNRNVYLRVVATGTQSATINLSQLNPILSFFSAGVALTSSTFNSGAYTVTSTDTTLTGTLTFTNTSGSSADYTVNVVDLANAPVAGSTTLSGTFADGATVTSSPFIFGSGTDDYVVVITLVG